MRIRRLAYTDALTGLGNRALVAERLPEILARAEGAGKEVAIFSVDLNGFRAINATRGQKIGDQLLRAMAARIRKGADGAELVARLGGDEFLVVEMERESSAEFEVTAGRLSASLSDRYVVDGDVEIRASSSIGIARFPRDGSDLDSLLGNADTALRSLKSSGRPGHVLYTAQMDAEKRARRAFESDISMAACAGQLSLVYQPQAEAATCTVTGFEALLRWNHPIHGFVSPAKFIPAAEACGAIVDIGAFVLKQALIHASRWHERMRVAVNVSPAQIVHADFAELVARLLAETRVDPARLEIEVTESLFINEGDIALKTLEAVKRLGVSVAIDDFGTGYSSLGTLRAFPFDRIKIDRSFVFDMVSNKDAAAIVDAILCLGRAMGRPVVAEGVETRAQIEELQRHGCSEVQGYLIGKPLPIDQYLDIVGASAAPPRVHQAPPRRRRQSALSASSR
jgi:diguanylate cyclase (GGDEF)-like protein